MKDVLLGIVIFATFYIVGQQLSDTFMMGWFMLLGANLTQAMIFTKPK